MTETSPSKRSRTPRANPDDPPEVVVEVDEPAPSNVVEALARVQAEIGGIEKMTPAERKRRGLGTGDEKGITYAYRGIDQVAAAAQPLFGRYGVVIVPRVGSYDTHDIELGGKPWLHGTMTVHWTIYGPGGVDDRIEATTIGEGRDNSDKLANKAMTGAYKNLLLRLLTIGDPADDTDRERHESDTVPPHPEAAEATRVYERITETAATDPHIVKALGEFGKQRQRRFSGDDLLDREWRGQVEAELDRLLAVDVNQDVEPDDEAMGDALAEGFDASVHDGEEGYGS